MSIDPSLTIRGIQELQQKNARMIHALKPEGARGRAMLYAITEAHRAAVAITHVGRYKVKGQWRGGGSLRASHRMKYDVASTTGTIYIDPTTRNPITNAKPSIYGVYEHGHGGTHRFYERVIEEHGDRIGRNALKMIEGDL